MNFRDKNVVIVGASRGLGKILANMSAREGANVILLARTETDLQKNIEEIRNAGGKGSFYTIDVTNAESVNNTFAQIFEEIDFIDVLICAAGVMKEFCFSNATFDDYQALNEVNANGVMRILFAAMPKSGRPNNKRSDQKEGLTIILSSMAGYLIPTDMEFYAITKYTSRGIGNAFRKHFQVENQLKMKVMVVCPAQFDTGLWATPKMQEWAQKMKAKNMLPFS